LPEGPWTWVPSVSLPKTRSAGISRFSDPGPPVEIRGEAIASGVAVEIADLGRSLLLGDEGQIFEMIYRGADAKPDRRGTGLRLTICKAHSELRKEH